MGETPPDTQSAILNVEPPDLLVGERAIPPALERVLRRCLEKLPEQRFQSASDLAFALDAMSSTSTGATSAMAANVPAMRRWGHAGWIAAAGLALVSSSGSRVPRFDQAPRPSIRPSFTLARRCRPSSQRLVPLRCLCRIPPSPPMAGTSPSWRAESEAETRSSGCAPSTQWMPGRVEGTDGATYPFWSADSASVAFFSGNKLKVISRDGSRLGEICDAPGGRGGIGTPRM